MFFSSFSCNLFFCLILVRVPRNLRRLCKWKFFFFLANIFFVAYLSVSAKKKSVQKLEQIQERLEEDKIFINALLKWCQKRNFVCFLYLCVCVSRFLNCLFVSFARSIVSHQLINGGASNSANYLVLNNCFF